MSTREVVRERLTTLLTAALVGVGKPCQEVVGYKPNTIEKAPMVCVLSGGSNRIYDSVDSLQILYSFALVVFVPDSDAATGWTEKDVEDTIDTIDELIQQTVVANRIDANWLELGYTGEASVVEDVTLSDATYATEVHMLNALVAA